MTDEAQIPDDEPGDVPEQQFDLFALRSFVLQVGRPDRMFSDESVWDRFYWEDGAARKWCSPSYPKAGDWENGTCEATCNRNRTERVAFGGQTITAARSAHEVPDERCGCGIYASLSYADLISQFHVHVKNIVTVIAAEGTTIIGSRGLRTQFARVVAFWVPPTSIIPPTIPPEWVGVGPRARLVNIDGAHIARDTAIEQFKDAAVFDCPLEMVESYGIALLPPSDAPGHHHRAVGGNWWTSKRCEK